MFNLSFLVFVKKKFISLFPHMVCAVRKTGGKDDIWKRVLATDDQKNRSKRKNYNGRVKEYSLREHFPFPHKM